MFQYLVFILLLSYKLKVVADRLEEFYERLKKEDVKFCSDRTKLLPACIECIPGLQKSSPTSTTCDEFIQDTKSIRSEIGKLTMERFGPKLQPNRIFGLYPCKLQPLYYSNLSITY